MKIVAVNAGLRKGWNTDTLITEAKQKRHDEVFPEHCRKAFELGENLVNRAK